MSRRGKPVSTHEAEAAKVLSGAQLRLARQQAHISLRTMAKLTGYSKGHLSNVETGTFPVTEQLVQRYQHALALNEVETRSIERNEAVVMASESNPEPYIVVSGTTSALPRKDRWRIETEIDAPVTHVCETMSLSCRVPSRFTSRETEQRPDLPAEYNLIAHAEVLVAYVGVNDSRTGLQLGWAHVAQVPIILLYELGNSEIADEYRLRQLALYDTICYQNRDDLESQLSHALFWLFSELNLKNAASQRHWTSELTDRKLHQLNDLRRRGKKLAAMRKPISRQEWIRDHPLAALEREELQHQA